MGKYVGTSSAIGCMCVNPCCREIRTMTLSTQSTHIEKVKIADANGYISIHLIHVAWQ
jgi:hypothetical protein